MVLALVSSLLGILAPETPTATAGSRDALTDVVASTAVIEGDASKVDRRQLASAIARGLDASQGDGSTAQTAQIDAEIDADCVARPECLEDLQAAGARYLITTRVEVSDRNYEFTVEAHDVRDGSEFTRAEDTCTLCGIAEAEEMLERQSASVLQKLQNLRLGPASFTVNTDPPGAQIFVDGELRGSAPLTVELDDGEHLIAAGHPGFARQERALSAVQGTREEVDFKLNALPPDERSAGFDRRTLWPVGWATLGVGLASMVTGAVFVGLDERPYRSACSGDDVDTQGNCRQRYDTMIHGGALLGVGAALSVAGTALVIVGAKARKGQTTEPRVRARIGPRGGSLRVRF